MTVGLRILLLGGTREARLLLERLIAQKNLDITLSLSGALGKDATSAFRKRMSQKDGIGFKIRTGGFGGIDGLVEFITEHKFNLIIDATHPFAISMSQNAVAAADNLACPIIRFARPAWFPQTGDNWIHVDSLQASSEVLAQGARAFLAIGKQSAFHFSHRTDCRFLIRSIEAMDTSIFHSPVDCIQSMPEESVAAEIALMKRYEIDCLVTKNSGAAQAYYKVEAARLLGIEVVMIDRPTLPPCPEFCAFDETISWINCLS
ncbi:cobalt-precorrin-6A reductase [Cohaesibacter celericrescens]|uniref:Cobalt-precorrin-6A reductase n=1 Tax=Cohaesibacter celericrescens TaxID=2067669 RepID=A0A2N5XVV7_9HYPH|nr:cobalt-precorrin-6A reductase [Cohaesibacter celericrescens]PLW78636.1 cobalt-precorrin-6A reductase [Cohaesibacter celericrescens]